MTYDVYRGYVNPNASGGRLLRLSHIVVIAFAFICACIASGLTRTAIGVNFIIVSLVRVCLFWLSYVSFCQTSIGIITAPAVFPIASTLLWKKQNTIAVVAAPLLGTATGLACWIGSTHHWYPAVSLQHT